MGEYATRRSDGQEIKIGTCENMYYLRYDQRGLIQPLEGNVDPHDPEIACELRFRFPWPDEDRIPPGDGKFHDNGYHRGIHIPGAVVPQGVEHSSVQFVAHAGYLVSLPCPEGQPDVTPGMVAIRRPDLTIHRNGFGGAVHLVAQKPTADGQTLRAILRCGGCGDMWRAETWEDAEPYVVALRAEADSRERQGDSGKFWHTIADRLEAGYHSAITV